ncbi:MAG: PTS glucose transporter subunit IIB [Metamycoplasmataceae bacterium]
MTGKEKFIYWFLTIITFGLIHLHWKTKKVAVKDELSRKDRITINMNKLINFLGGPENISSVESTHTKVKIFLKNREIVEIENIRSINGISGVFVTSNYLQIIVGNEALLIEQNLNSLITLQS